MAVRERIKTLLEQLNTGIFEKEEVMALVLLSSVAGESIFLLGPPGVAKSLIARRLKYAYKDATVFEYLMSRFSTPDEIFGPVSISKLKNDDKYERITKNYLPEAWVVFLDEIWKAGPSIQNALLTILNEKVYRNGEKEMKVQMKALVSASNELPAREQGLEALWDRFLVRFVVGSIEDQEKFNKMITMPSLVSFKNEIEGTITDKEYEEWSNKIDEVSIPDNILNVIHVIKNKIKLHNEHNKENAEKPIYVSDRRWRKIVRLMRTSAFLNDRKEVDLMDCFLIKHCIWNEEEQIDSVWQYVSRTIEDNGYKLPLDLSVIEETLKKFNDEVVIWTTNEIIEDYFIPKVLTVKQDKYYRVSMVEANNNFFIKEGDMIKKSEVDKLKKLEEIIETTRYREEPVNGGVFIGRLPSFSERVIFIKKSDKEDKLLVSDNGTSWGKIVFESSKRTKKKEVPRQPQPHEAIIKDWEKRIKVIRKNTGELKLQIENYKTNDMADIHNNIFVDASFAEYVENNLNRLKKQIELLEVEADRIENAYTKIEPVNKAMPLLEQSCLETSVSEQQPLKDSKNSAQSVFQDLFGNQPGVIE